MIATLIGFAFGFIGSMPIAGPIAAIVFVRAMDGRASSALAVGAGSVFAETAWAFLAFWGFATLLSDNPWIAPAAHAVAAAILVVLGVMFLRRKGSATAAPPDRGQGARGALLGLTISGLNPTLLATWTGASTTLYATGLVDVDPALAVPFALGAGAGIFSWYFVLVRLVTRYRERFNPGTLNKIIRGFGGFVLCVAVWFVYRLVDALLAL